MYNPFTIAAVLDRVLEWIAARVADVIDALWRLLSWAFLVVPDVTALPQVQTISTRALFVANTCYVVAIVACGVVVMARDSVQARYGVAELAPRLLIGIIGANFAMPMCRELIAVGNALIQALIGESVTTDGSLDQLRRTIVDALTNPANALLTLVIGVVIAVLAAMIMAGWVLRLGLLVILVGLAPAALACHGTPWTEPVAKLWWRAFLGVFATVGGQGIALHAGLTVFVSPTANLPALGLPNDPTGTLNLFIVCCLLLAVTRIPGLVRRYVTGGQSRNVVGAFVRVAIVQQLGRALTGGLWGGAGRAAAGAVVGRTRRAGNLAARFGGVPLPQPAGVRPGAGPGPVARRPPRTAAASTSASPSQAEPGVGVRRVPSGRTPATVMPQRMPRWRRWWAYTESGIGWPSGASRSWSAESVPGLRVPPVLSAVPESARTASGTGWPSVPIYGPRTTRTSAAARAAATTRSRPRPSPRPAAGRDSSGTGWPG
ncbi:hypothetical protein [Micromonospora sediminimaris]|uniref:TrbL/VirB6 plasmid conjugal transfer protein n=1 Tax=Micromonospora sediminimaris TaxID=547162 RepID=A0A9W5UVJ2_9ACTN|nr:hypothetical protein [Micromonospora sediminimaris]GIJ35018.1 hypothetical protein Vse01_41660 [Micromonospora sediminimaris]SFD28280.1 hypothetical protein SAMN05216284_11470 [Micromonospora sediminimaris]